MISSYLTALHTYIILNLIKVKVIYSDSFPIIRYRGVYSRNLLAKYTNVLF